MPTIMKLAGKIRKQAIRKKPKIVENKYILLKKL
jgi:hypothetical protein